VSLEYARDKGVWRAELGSAAEAEEAVAELALALSRPPTPAPADTAAPPSMRVQVVQATALGEAEQGSANGAREVTAVARGASPAAQPRAFSWYNERPYYARGWCVLES
jgi:hypothetical protein